MKICTNENYPLYSNDLARSQKLIVKTPVIYKDSSQDIVALQ